MQHKEEILHRIADILGVSVIFLKSNYINPMVNICIDIYWTQMLSTNLSIISMSMLFLKKAEKYDSENYQIFNKLNIQAYKRAYLS